MSNPPALATRRAVLALVCLALFVPSAQAQLPARPDADAYAKLRWRFSGPEGNRFSSVAGIAGDPKTYYVGAASGGIYKSTDAGKTWALMGLEQTGRIPRLVIDPRNPDLVLACALGRQTLRRRR
jgi:hypothetical protein